MGFRLSEHRTTEGAIIGVIAGLVVAWGGSTKDAPYEGFNMRTFFRSPIIGGIVGGILNTIFKADKPMLFLGTIGGERAVVEGYKIIRVQKPGKFTYGEWGIPKNQLA